MYWAMQNECQATTRDLDGDVRLLQTIFRPSTNDVSRLAIWLLCAFPAMLLLPVAMLKASAFISNVMYMSQQ